MLLPTENVANSVKEKPISLLHQGSKVLIFNESAKSNLDYTNDRNVSHDMLQLYKLRRLRAPCHLTILHYIIFIVRWRKTVQTFENSNCTHSVSDLAY